MDAKHAVASLAALAQESRLLIFRLLVEAGPTGLAVGEIGASLHVAPATLSFHLKELYHAGLVATRQDGRFVYYSANYERMNSLLGYLTENCCARDGVACAPARDPRSCSPTPRRARRDKSKT
jgi:DNA-binding transcriptional ArsR family regulator